MGLLNRRLGGHLGKRGFLKSASGNRAVGCGRLRGRAQALMWPWCGRGFLGAHHAAMFKEWRGRWCFRGHRPPARASFVSSETGCLLGHGGLWAVLA